MTWESSAYARCASPGLDRFVSGFGLASEVLICARMKFFFAAACAAVVLAGALDRTAQAMDRGVQPMAVRTNFVDRWITNSAEVQFQVNRFVTEYHTNWFTRVRTTETGP